MALTFFFFGNQAGFVVITTFFGSDSYGGVIMFSDVSQTSSDEKLDDGSILFLKPLFDSFCSTAMRC